MVKMWNFKLASFVQILISAVLLGQAQECKISSNDPCRISGVHGVKPRGESYVSMCSCSPANPTFCDGVTCRTCLLAQAPCTLNTPCCPVLNARSFCNVNSGKCEVTRFCGTASRCPFDDLSAVEITTVMSIIRQSGKFPPTLQFPVIRAQEPIKSDWNGGESIPRIAFAGVWVPETNTLTEVLIDLQKQRIVKMITLKNQLPRRMNYETGVITNVLLNGPDSRWRDAMLKRKLDPAKATFKGATLGSSGPIWPPETLVTKVSTFYDDVVHQFDYWRKVEGILVTLELRTGRILEFLDVEMTNLTSRFEQYPNFRTKPPLKPLVITQPNGTSIRVKGQGIEWYKWKLRYSMDPIHGLQLFHVRYYADCEYRLVLYKISLSEMFVPYGGKGPTWRFKSPLDAGEIGMGVFANSMRIGLDLPENAIRLSCAMANDTGADPYVIPGCVGVYERDLGTLYKHTDWTNGNNIVGQRGRQLVITFTSTVGNYEYGFDYILNMDGTIEVKVRLTGIIYPRGVEKRVNNPSCIEDCLTLTNFYLIGPAHEHFFNFRLDFDLDGINNYVTEVNVENDPIGPGNPDGGSFSVKRDVLEQEGFRDYNLRNARNWQIVNPNSRNRFGTPRGFALKPLEAAYPFLHKGNPYLPQAEFVEHPFWATVYKDTEQSADGNYPRSGIPRQGLPKFIEERESLKNADAVAWYTFGVVHATRPEEWPIMDVHVGGFSLVPYNFHSRNAEVPLQGICSGAQGFKDWVLAIQ